MQYSKIRLVAQQLYNPLCIMYEIEIQSLHNRPGLTYEIPIFRMSLTQISPFSSNPHLFCKIRKQHKSIVSSTVVQYKFIISLFWVPSTKSTICTISMIKTESINFSEYVTKQDPCPRSGFDTRKLKQLKSYVELSTNFL